MSRFTRLANAVQRPALASTAAGMCLAMSVTGLAVAETATATPQTHRTATVSISDAAYTTTAQRQERRRHRHVPRGTSFVRRSNKHVRFHGTAKDPDRPHRQIKIVVWRNGHRARIVKTHWHKHHYHASLKLQYGKNRFVVRARNVGKGSDRGHLRTVRFHRARHRWADRYHGNQRIAAHMLHQHGWSHSQMRPLVLLWNRESGWSKTAYNSSGAYGIPQALPGRKMSSAGPNWRYNAHTQIRWGMRYIKHRYGTPSNAWAHSQSTGWY
jgi:hypothetical protein